MKVLIFFSVSSTARLSTPVESTPPLSKTPTGTSAIMCSRTVSARRLSKFFLSLFYTPGRSGGSAKAQVPILPDDRLAVLQLEVMPGRELPNSLEQRLLARHIQERQEPVDQLRSDFSLDRWIRENRLDFRRKDESSICQTVIKRLNSNSIPRQEKRSWRFHPRLQKQTFRVTSRGKLDQTPRRDGRSPQYQFWS